VFQTETRVVADVTASNLGRNGNLQRLTLNRQALTMWISQSEGKLVPQLRMRSLPTTTAGPGTSPKQGQRTPNETTDLLHQSTPEEHKDLHGHLARQQRFDEADFVKDRLAFPTVMVAMDSIQPNRLALKPMVELESPNALKSIQHRCGTARPGTSYMIDQVFMSDGSGEMQVLQPFIDYGTMSVCMVP